MYFASDNWAGAHPNIAQSLVGNSTGMAAAYGKSDLDRVANNRFSEVFERDVEVFFVATGTAANTLSLAALNRPGGVAFCHAEAHLNVDECCAPEFLTGAKLVGLSGSQGRIDPIALRAGLDRFRSGLVHIGRPMAVSLTQATEAGTAYSLSEIEGIAELGRERGVCTHMDGARFANALVALEASPAEMTWRRGIDVLSFGGTKNGCWCAEAVVVFDKALACELGYLRKRSAHLLSKSRFVAAQFVEYLSGDLWLDLARHANAMARMLAAGINASDKVQLHWQPQTNSLFPIMDKSVFEFLIGQGVSFYSWRMPEELKETYPEKVMARMVTSFATTNGEVSKFCSLIV